MITFLLLTQILLPLALLAWFVFLPAKSRLGFGLQGLAIALFLVTLTHMGLWIVPPWWTPYLYWLLFLLAGAIGWQRQKVHKNTPSSILGWALVVGLVAFSVYFSNEAIQSVAAQTPPNIAPVDLAFPLPQGEYLVLNGGTDIRVNAHLKTQDPSVPRFRAYRGNAYGIDLVKINLLGLRATGLSPRDPVVYDIYGESVLAPCTGTIATAVDGLPDMPIPEFDRAHLAGNHVLLRCGDFEVAMAHFRPNSLLVQPGDGVKTGDRIAEVGNSGVSDEPHLHIHAQRPGTLEAPMSGNPLPIRFDGRFLVRGDRISIP